MSTLSFVERIELEFSGNHFSHALCLEDVDNDGVSILMYLCMFIAQWKQDLLLLFVISTAPRLLPKWGGIEQN